MYGCNILHASFVIQCECVCVLLYLSLRVVRRLHTHCHATRIPAAAAGQRRRRCEERTLRSFLRCLQTTRLRRAHTPCLCVASLRKHKHNPPSDWITVCHGNLTKGGSGNKHQLFDNRHWFTFNHNDYSSCGTEFIVFGCECISCCTEELDPFHRVYF